MTDKLEQSRCFTGYFEFAGDRQRQARYPALAAASDIIKKQDENRWFTSTWSDLSWRAIVPIYVQQQNANSRTGDVDGSLVEAIADIIDPSVMRLGEAQDPAYGAPGQEVTGNGGYSYLTRLYDLRASDIRDLIEFYYTMRREVRAYRARCAARSTEWKAMPGGND